MMQQLNKFATPFNLTRDTKDLLIEKNVNDNFDAISTETVPSETPIQLKEVNDDDLDEIQLSEDEGDDEGEEDEDDDDDEEGDDGQTKTVTVDTCKSFNPRSGTRPTAPKDQTQFWMPNGKDGGIQLRLAGKKSRTIANYEGYLEMKLPNDLLLRKVSLLQEILHSCQTK